MSKSLSVVRQLFATELKNVRNQKQNMKDLEIQDNKLFEEVQQNKVVMELSKKLIQNAVKTQDQRFKMTDQHFIAQNIVGKINEMGRGPTEYTGPEPQDLENCKSNGIPIVFQIEKEKNLQQQENNFKADILNRNRKIDENIFTQNAVLLNNPNICGAASGCQDRMLLQYLKYSNSKESEAQSQNSLEKKDTAQMYAKFSSNHICKYKFNADDCYHNDDIIQIMLHSIKDYKLDNKTVYKNFDIQAIIALQTQIVKSMCDKVINMFGLVQPVENAHQAENAQQASQPSSKQINQNDMYQFFIKCFSMKQGDYQHYICKAIFEHHATSTIQAVNYINSPLSQFFKVYVPDFFNLPDEQKHFMCNLLSLGANCRKFLDLVSNYICFCLLTGLLPLFVTQDEKQHVDITQYPQQLIQQLLDSQDYLYQPCYYNQITSSLLIVSPDAVKKSPGENRLCVERQKMQQETKFACNQINNTKVLVKIVDQSKDKLKNAIIGSMSIAQQISLQPDTPEQKRKIEKQFNACGAVTKEQQLAVYCLREIQLQVSANESNQILNDQNPIQTLRLENTNMEKLLQLAQKGGDNPEEVKTIIKTLQQNENIKRTDIEIPQRFDKNYQQVAINSDNEIRNTREQIFNMLYGEYFEPNGDQKKGTEGQIMLEDGSIVNGQREQVLRDYLNYFDGYDKEVSITHKQEQKEFEEKERIEQEERLKYEAQLEEQRIREQERIQQEKIKFETKIKGEKQYLNNAVAENVKDLNDIKLEQNACIEERVWSDIAAKIYELRNKKDVKTVQDIQDLVADIQFIRKGITPQVLLEVFNDETRIDLQNQSVFNNIKESISYWFLKYRRINVLQKINFVPKQEYSFLKIPAMVGEKTKVNDQLYDAIFCIALNLNDMVKFQLKNLKDKEVFAALLIEGGMQGIMTAQNVPIDPSYLKTDVRVKDIHETKMQQPQSPLIDQAKQDEMNEHSEQKDKIQQHTPAKDVKQNENIQQPQQQGNKQPEGEKKENYDVGFKGLEKDLIAKSESVWEFKKKAESLQNVDYANIRTRIKEDSMLNIDVKIGYGKYVLTKQLAPAWRRAHELFADLDKIFDPIAEKVKHKLYESGAFELTNMMTMLNNQLQITFSSNADCQAKVFYSIWCLKLELWCPLDKFELTSEEVTQAQAKYPKRIANIKVEPESKQLYEVMKLALMDGDACLEKCNIMKKK